MWWDWVRQLVMVLLVALVADLAMPRSSYQPYLRLITGLVVVLTVLQPLFTLRGATIDLERLIPGQGGPGPAQTPEAQALPRAQVTPEARVATLTEDLNSALDRQVREAVRRGVARQVEVLLRERGPAAAVRVELEFSRDAQSIERIVVHIRPTGGMRIDERLRQEIAAHLGVRPGRVRLVEEG